MQCRRISGTEEETAKETEIFKLQRVAEEEVNSIRHILHTHPLYCFFVSPILFLQKQIMLTDTQRWRKGR